MYCFSMIHAGKHLKAREDPPCIRITDYVTNILWKNGQFESCETHESSSSVQELGKAHGLVTVKTDPRVV